MSTTEKRTTLSSRYKAVIYIVLSALGFATMGMLVKLAGDLPVMQKVFFRNFVAALVMAGVIKKNGTSLFVKPENRKALLMRCAVGTVGILGNYFALQYLILPDATILGKLSPFFTMLYSAILLHEKVNRRQLTALLISFAGCALVIQPSFQSGNLLPVFIAVMGGAGAGIAYVYVRYLTTHGENKNVVILYFSLFSSAVALPFMIISFEPMTLSQVVIMVGAGTAAAIGQFGMTNAYARAPGRFLGPFEYSQLLFSAAYSFLIFGELPTLIGVLGYCIIVAVSLWMLHGKEE